MSDQRGAVAVLAAVGLTLTVWLGLSTVELAVAVGRRVALQTAADASALAAVGASVRGEDPVAAASVLARENGASLARCSCPRLSGSRLVATVRTETQVRLPFVGTRVIGATATAEYVPGDVGEAPT